MKVDTQEIPSELLFDYSGSLRESTQWWTNLFGTFKFKGRKFGLGPNVYIVRGRQPFRLPHMQGLGPSTPSWAQIQIRKAFKRCCDCFNEQPWSGGAEPDGIGPYSRTWWFAQATPSSLWYYNYFIYRSWLPFFTKDTPKWCIKLKVEGSFAKREKKGARDISEHANYSTRRAEAWNNFVADEPGPTGVLAVGMKGIYACPNEDQGTVGYFSFKEWRQQIKFDLRNHKKWDNCVLEFLISPGVSCPAHDLVRVYKDATWEGWGDGLTEIGSRDTRLIVNGKLRIPLDPDDVKWEDYFIVEIRFRSGDSNVVPTSCPICSDEGIPACAANCCTYDEVHDNCECIYSWHWLVAAPNFILEY